MLESVLKLFGVGVAMSSLAFYSTSPLHPLSSLEITQITFLGVSLVLHAFLIVQRFFYKELFRLVLVLAAIVAHVTVMIVLFNNRGKHEVFVFIFAFLFCLGQVCTFFLYYYENVDWSAHVWLESTKKRILLSSAILISLCVVWVMQLVIWYATTYQGDLKSMSH